MTDLIAQLTALSGIGADMLWLGLVVFLRVGCALSLTPAFGEQVVPMRVRLALAFAFTAIVAPAAGEGRDRSGPRGSQPYLRREQPL